MDEYVNFVNGITTSPAADMLPQTWSPRGRNTHLVSIGQNGAQMGGRQGLLTGNATPVTGSPSMIGQYQLKRLSGTKIHMLVSDGGRLDKYNTDTTTSAINAAAFTAGTNFPAFATVNDICVIANGVNLKKTDGATVWAVGMTRPAAPTATITAGGSMSTGVWDVALTYLNSVTGEESSLSDFSSVTAAAGNLSITVSWSAPSDAQVDYVRVYLRKQTLGSGTYRVIAGAAPAANATWGGFATITPVLSTVLDVSDTVFGAFRLTAPSTTENNPPTVTWQYPVVFNNRLFLFDKSNAYYSNITDGTPHPESFDPNNVEAISPGDGDVITGAVVAFDRLYIFKKYSMWQIVGYDPTSWTVTRVSDKYGCGAHRTIVLAGGALYWWSSTSLGPLTLQGPDSQPLEFGKELLSSTVSDTAINTLLLNYAVAEVDEPRDVIVFSVPLTGSSVRNNIIIPFNYRLKRFVSDAWNPMDIASFAVVEDTASGKNLYAGGYSGQIFKWWSATNDGVASGTKSGTLTSAGTSTTLVDSTAAFNTTGGKNIERYVYHIPVSGAVQRRRITANTGTALTITPAWSQAPVIGDSYIIGAIDWQLDTPWTKSESAFLKKRFEFLFVEASSTANGVLLYADVYTKDNLSTAVKTILYTLGTPGSLYGTGVYGTAKYAAASVLNSRKKVGRVGKSYRIRLRQLQSDKQLTLERVAMQGSILGTKT